MTFLILIIHKCDAGNETSIYQESGSQTPPTKCVHWLHPAYNVEEYNNAHRLVIDVSQIAAKNLNVDVDYEKRLINVLGWIESTFASSGDKSVDANTCIYQQWEVRSEMQDSRFDDLVMELKDGKLVISIPISVSKNAVSTEDTEMLQEYDSKRTLPLRVTTEGRKLRGLARISQARNSTSMLRSYHSKTHHADERMSQKSKQKEALEKFIAVSLTNTDEEAYWLHRM
jgi:hypothetical protein